jgi:aminopeptidase N
VNREFAFPGTRPRFAPDRVVDVEHISLVLDVDPNKRTVSGTATLRAMVIAPTTKVVELDAVELTIDKVTAGGKGVPFRHDGRRLRVELASALATGAELTLVIDYKGAPRRGLYFVGPDEGYPDKPLQVWTQGQDEDSRYWFPCFDAPSEKATSEVKVTVPASMFALSNGTLVSDKTSGGKRTLHWRLEVPHSCYLITLAVGDFGTVETKWHDLPVVYHVARGREEAAERTLARTPQMLELFSQKFGVPYPYPRYAQVFVADFIFGGMENTSATTLTDTVLMDERATIDYDIDSLVAHELAHQWFGDLVTCRDWGEGWLNEGFATYAEYIWREHHEGRDAADLELEEWADQYFGEDAGRYRRTIATKLYDEPIDIFDHHLYEKGGRVLHMLRNVLGDELFYKVARALPRQAPPRGGRVARPRARIRGRDRQGGRLVLLAVGDRRLGPPRARHHDPLGPRHAARHARRRANAEGRRTHADLSAADQDSLPDRRERRRRADRDRRPEAGVPPQARHRTVAGDFRSGPRAARHAQDRQAGAGLDQRARVGDARDRSRGRRTIARQTRRVGRRASVDHRAREGQVLGRARQCSTRARHDAHAHRPRSSGQAAQG